MKGIALAGYVLTVEEWQELDELARAQLVAAMMQWEDPAPQPILARGSSPAIAIPEPAEGS